MSHPQYDMLLASLREGMSGSDIARYYANEGWLTVSEKTFAEYITAFRRRQWRMIASDTERGGAERIDLNRRVQPAPPLNLDSEVDRAIRFQKIRIGLGHTQEDQIGLPLEQVTKDMVVLGKYLELKGKHALGTIVARGASQMGPLQAPEQVRSELNKVVKSQGEADKLYEMTATLLQNMNSRNDD